MNRHACRSRVSILLGAAAPLLIAAAIWAQPGAERMTHGKDPGHTMVMPDALKWTKGPASLPPGVEMAVLEGDPAAAGPFTMRLKAPAGYEIPAHHHPQIEHVTVISGKFFMGMGDKLDRQNATELPPGGFAVMAIGTRHFAFAGDEETIVQVHGMGPWGITYVDPATDPRN